MSSVKNDDDNKSMGKLETLILYSKSNNSSCDLYIPIDTESFSEVSNMAIDLSDEVVTTAAAEATPTIDDELKLQIVQYNPPWPDCSYSANSRRNKLQQQQQLQRQQYENNLGTVLKDLEGWSKHPEISIDGMNGTGKSSLCKQLNRKYIKINSLAPHVTCGSDYNYDPIKSMEYLMLPLLVTAKNVCWDRCPYSNLIFYFVHQLMAIYKDTPIPNDISEVWRIFNTIAADTQLIATINYTKSIKSIPTLFIVCSDIKYISLALQDRGGLNDIYNAKQYNYQMAQYYAYMYFGKLLQAPVLDLKHSIMDNQTLNDIQIRLQRVLDVDINANNESTVSLPNIDISSKFSEFMSVIGNDDVLIYDYSKK